MRRSYCLDSFGHLELLPKEILITHQFRFVNILMSPDQSSLTAQARHLAVQNGQLNRLEVYKEFKYLSQLKEHRCEVVIVYTLLQTFIDRDELSDAPEEVLEEGHHHGCEVGEELQLVLGEDCQVLYHIIASEHDIRTVTYSTSRVIQFVIKCPIKIAPLQQGYLCKPEVDRSIEATRSICCVIIGLSTFQEGRSITFSHVFVLLIKIRT